MKKIIWKYKDSDNVIIRTPMCRSLDEVIKTLPENAEYKIIDSVNLPDKYFRDAWTYDLKIDIEKAKEIQKDRLRAEREKAFKVNDDKRAVAVRRGEPIEEIDAEAERLCDIPQLVDACKTLEEIKAVKI